MNLLHECVHALQCKSFRFKTLNGLGDSYSINYKKHSVTDE